MFGDLSASIPAWGVVVVLALPALDLLHSLTPWSKRLWVDHDHEAWATFWSVATVLRWVQAGVAVAVLAVADVSLAAVGLQPPSTPVLAGSALLAVGSVAWYGVVVLRTPAVPRADAPTDFETTYPADVRERVLWLISGGLTAGVCEEFVYRGVALVGLLGLGLPWPVAVLGSALAFAFAHGLAVVNPVAVAFYVVFALLMTGVVAATGSLLPAMAAHAAWNLGGVARSLETTTPAREEVPA